MTIRNLWDALDPVEPAAVDSWGEAISDEVDTHVDATEAAAAAPVQTVNTQTGEVVLGAADVGADPAGSADAAQAHAVQRANHTGTQAQSTVTDLESDLAAKLEADDIAPLPTGGATGDLFIVRQTASGFEYVEITEDPA